VTTLQIGRSTLILVLLAASAFHAMFMQTVSSQQYTTETIGYTTTTVVSLFNTTILSLSNVTETIVQTNTLTSQVTIMSLSSTQITMTDTLPSVRVKTVESSFLDANAGWLLPLLVFVGVLALLLVAGRIVGIEK
jgi:carbohydrate-binding DOMON domain-containing protein